MAKGYKQIYLFAEGYRAFGGDHVRMREELGGKGAGLAEMTACGVRVPPGMTIPTSVCRQYYKNNQKVPEGLFEEIFEKLTQIEQKVGRKLGDTEKPLLVSVRSGAKFSMPGMMDTVLNLGLNDQTVESLIKLTANPRFAWDSYRRFVQIYANVVLEIKKSQFEDIITDKKRANGIKSDTELDVEDLKYLVTRFKTVVKMHAAAEFPQDVRQQLRSAVEAVFRSWNNPRAIYYRNLNKIDHDLGTAVSIQAMVFGNLDDRSATGVCFTRNPSTGGKELYGEYLVNAQGEDVVAGVRTPNKIKQLKDQMRPVYDELVKTTGQLEEHYKDVQDIEFTIEQGKLYILQTRTGKRTAAAAVKIAVDMANEKIINRTEALMRVEPQQLNQLLLPGFTVEEREKAKQAGRLLAVGLNASPGGATGEVVFAPDDAERLAHQGKKVILVRIETCPDDIHGIVPSQGVVTSRGGMTSHAAVVARGMGKPCVAGCESLKIDLEAETVEVNGTRLQKGNVISIDGSTGEVYNGTITMHEPEIDQNFKLLLNWADESRRLGVMANADTPEDARVALGFGAQGVGLCRTEHMFMKQERLPVMQAMIMAANSAERRSALEKLLPMQREDFKGIFRVMDGLPVTIRLLDPPLHEFLPKEDDLMEEISRLKSTMTGDVADSADKSLSRERLLKEKQQLLTKVRELKEANPMMGLRGCRLGLLFPEINEMQVTAIFEAAISLKKEGLHVHPEIMIPLVGHINELRAVKDQLEEAAAKVIKREGQDIDYEFGTMIEIPRACLIAGEIAQYAEFFSFGTNDLTQTTFGFSRDDAERTFLTKYLEGIDVNGVSRKILEQNPFEMLDQNGVGKLMKIAVEYGLQARPNLKLGICGEHGGDPSSIAFAHEIGLTYVSCSPYRIPLARLAAAQAAIGTRERDK